MIMINTMEGILPIFEPYMIIVIHYILFMLNFFHSAWYWWNALIFQVAVVYSFSMFCGISFYEYITIYQFDWGELQ